MEHWIGIDVSSATLDFALLDGKGTHLESVQIENDRKAVMKLMGQWSKRHGVEVGKSLICLEATGHYTLMMLNLIVGQQWHAWLAHPNDIQQSMGIKRVKNDKVDALRIAQYARTFHEKARLFTAQNLKLDRLKHLITRRNHLVRSRARHRTHITDLNRYMDRQLRTEFDRIDKRRIKLEDQLVAHVDALILAEIRTDPQTERQYDLLRTIPGVGPQARRIPGGLHRWLCTLQHAAPALVPCRCRTLRAQAQAAACVAAPKCRIKLISRSRPCCTCPRW